ncbi:5-formyltetrahydrofolate cyclo-ligase [Alloscardovia omnicolens]|uniref:5-formyltetrahydrofolate cyclo-ligase n=1 Tax=Alloscardovia omnicolens TaxID=419015 RepID=UPI003A602778
MAFLRLTKKPCAYNSSMTKADIRAHALSAMKMLDPHLKQRLDEQLTRQLCATALYKQAHTIATYMSLPHEFNTMPLIERALDDGKQVLIPRTRPCHHMDFCDYKNSTFQQSRFGIREPQPHSDDSIVPAEQIDIIHVPLLAVNSQGFRIGYGGGYYDRYLAHYAGSTISTAYECQLYDFEPDSCDIAVQQVLIAEH